MLYVQNLHFIIQDREHQNRIHLAGTVEELKKFNSRRRLRAATLAAAAADDEEDEEQPARRAVMLEEANAAGMWEIIVKLAFLKLQTVSLSYYTLSAIYPTSFMKLYKQC